MNKKQFIYALSLALLVSILFRSSVIVLTPSIDKTLLLKVPKTIEAKYQVNTYVTTLISNNTIGTQLITKQIGCLPNQIITIKAREVFCDNKSLGVAKTFSLNRTALEITSDIGVIPDGYVYLKGEHIDSYDSRYFGLIKLSKLQKLIPIF